MLSDRELQRVLASVIDELIEENKRLGEAIRSLAAMKETVKECLPQHDFEAVYKKHRFGKDISESGRLESPRLAEVAQITARLRGKEPKKKT